MDGDDRFLRQLQARVRPRDPEPVQAELVRRRLVKGTPREAVAQGNRLPFEQEELLVRINRDPFVPMGERRRELGYGTNTKGWEKLKDAVVKDGYALPHEIVTGGSGGACKMLGLTQRGKAYLEAQGNTIHPALRHGDLPHAYYLSRVKTFYDERYECRIDEALHVGGEAYRPDLLCLGEADRGAVEIVSSRNVAKDIEKLRALRQALDWITVATASEELRQRFDEALRTSDGSDQDNVRVVRAPDLLKKAR